MNIKENPQIKFPECKDKNRLPFDNAILDDKICPIPILIEYDGEQHFEPIYFGGGTNQYKSFYKNQKRDYIKTKFALQNGYILLRISYSEYDNIEYWILLAIKISNERQKKKLIISNEYLYKSLINKVYYL